MAITIYPLGIGVDSTGSELRIVVDADVNETAENNVNDGPASVKAVLIDNTANAAVEYMKFYDTAGAVVVGTTAPSMILMAPVSGRVTYVFPNGVTFSAGLGFAAVTGAGTAGTTGPTSDMLAYITLG